MRFKLPSWLGRRRPLVTPVHVQFINFHCEQDGPAERKLKAQWQPILAGSTEVTHAYLVCVSYGAEETDHVMLALRSTGGLDHDLVFSLRAVFAYDFHRDSTLDICYVNAAQESQILEVCRPFYVAP